MLKEKVEPEESYGYLEINRIATDQKQEILQGLEQSQKTIHPKYFYDTKGSELFEKITRLPEYYPTTTEVRILKDYANEIAEVCGTGNVVIEPGSGNSEKIRSLLNAIKPSQYVPIDIAGEFLNEAARKLANDFTWLDIYAIAADFHQLTALPQGLYGGTKLVFYPGSTIGNMPPAQAEQFLSKIRGWLSTGDAGLLIGIDLHKSKEKLEAAYNDKQGITAAFNCNILENINSLAKTNFNTDEFDHRAIYNTDKNRIEMYLDAKRAQTVTLNNTKISVSAGESILTEYSYKYTHDGIAQLAANSGFEMHKQWIDEDSLFSVNFLRPI